MPKRFQAFLVPLTGLALFAISSAGMRRFSLPIDVERASYFPDQRLSEIDAPSSSLYHQGSFEGRASLEECVLERGENLILFYSRFSNLGHARIVRIWPSS